MTASTTDFLSNYASMTPEQVRDAMIAYLSEDPFSEELPATPENINWMVAVYAIEQGDVCCAAGLKDLLGAMEKHHAGPISVHEGWGGCEADSNQELIVQKLEFDLRENPEDHNKGATLGAVELGWIDADYYDTVLDDISLSFTIDPTLASQSLIDMKADERPNADCFNLYWRTSGEMEAYAYGKGRQRYCHYEQSVMPTSKDEWMTLILRLRQIADAAVQARYIRAYLTRKGFPMYHYGNPSDRPAVAA